LPYLPERARRRHERTGVFSRWEASGLGQRGRYGQVMDRRPSCSATDVAAHSGAVTAIAFADDGRDLVSGHSNGTGTLIERETASGRKLRDFKARSKSVKALIVMLDGLVLSASEDGTVRLWDRSIGADRTVHRGEKARFTHLAVSPDGRTIPRPGRQRRHTLDRAHRQRNGQDRAVARERAFDRMVGRRRDRTCRGLAVNSAVFAPDGGRILTASTDKTARLWDRDGNPLATLGGHTSGVNSAVFAPDGGRIVTASDDKTARLWEAFPDPQTLVDRVKAEVPRCLTPDQRQRFFLAPTPPRWCAAMHNNKWPYDAATP
jgi:WD40 repeat protein